MLAIIKISSIVSNAGKFNFMEKIMRTLLTTAVLSVLASTSVFADNAPNGMQTGNTSTQGTTQNTTTPSTSDSMTNAQTQGTQTQGTQTQDAQAQGAQTQGSTEMQSSSAPTQSTTSNN
jgi:hypothetical protein